MHFWLHSLEKQGTKIEKFYFTVTPHSFVGGFKIELLDKKEKLLRTLTPMAESKKKDGFIGEDPTQQHYSVELPSSGCVGCTVGDSFLWV